MKETVGLEMYNDIPTVPLNLLQLSSDWKLYFTTWIHIWETMFWAQVDRYPLACCFSPGCDYSSGMMLCVKRNECVNVSEACSIQWLITHSLSSFLVPRYSFIFSHLKSHSESFYISSSVPAWVLYSVSLLCFEWMQGVAAQTGNSTVIGSETNSI